MFFQWHILVCSCIPVANSSCKFYLHWGKHSQAQKLSKQILIRCQVSMIDELANVSPNGNRICNWNLQLECNCRKLHRRICNWKNTRSGSPCENGSVPLQQNCSLMRALRIQCYKSVWVLMNSTCFVAFCSQTSDKYSSWGTRQNQHLQVIQKAHMTSHCPQLHKDI